MLVEANVDIHSTTNDGSLPLHYFAGVNWLPTVKHSLAGTTKMTEIAEVIKNSSSSQVTHITLDASIIGE